MPNMLAHIGVQSVVTRVLIRDAEPRWIFLGCLLPDVPWILLRLGRVLLPGLSPYDLWLYAVIQASAAACLLLSAALAFVSEQPTKIFRLLGLNVVFHLLLDACETKWANGVHLFAPLSWALLNFGLFWPESWPILLLTIFGLAYGAQAWRYVSHKPPPASPRPRWRRLSAIILMLAYVWLPLAFLSGPYALDNHSVKTLQERELRTGRPVEFDRKFYYKHPAGDRLHILGDEALHVTGIHSPHAGLVSVRATFVDPTTIHIEELHVHWGASRDLASYLGLGLLAGVWLRPHMPRRRTCRNTL